MARGVGSKPKLSSSESRSSVISVPSSLVYDTKDGERIMLGFARTWVAWLRVLLKTTSESKQHQTRQGLPPTGTVTLSLCSPRPRHPMPPKNACPNADLLAVVEDIKSQCKSDNLQHAWNRCAKYGRRTRVFQVSPPHFSSPQVSAKSPNAHHLQG